MNDIISFDEIDEHGSQTVRGAYDVPPAELDRDEAAGGARVEIQATVAKGDLEGEYVADGTAVVTADLECSRCVEPYPFANTSGFHVRFRPRLEVSEENEEIEITDKEELDVEFYTERTIPLREFALEQVQLAIPMKPLCDENCLGLCPTCGAVRSREKCSCENSIVDERWGALQGIREELSKKKDV
ncbi:MAG: DUF177 domain-containing protein [Acidobacteria bacterium]|nr:DUF177 domain-containing protein [Acidobacteriota bacterium]MBV9476258.1 DUF177 domain-containing protein [Acidobacteriota bacterium]